MRAVVSQLLHLARGGVLVSKLAEVRAAIYLRISQDRTGEERGVDRQRADCEGIAERRGWEVVQVYVDNDVSAKGDKARPQWEAMMAAVESGQLNVIIGWTIDRTLRFGRDRLRMLESGKEHGITISLARGSDMDLSTPSGRLAADIVGAVALAEIEMKADRQRAAHRQAAGQGRRFGGRRPFGFEQDGMTVRPAEAEQLVAAYHDYLCGTPLSAIAKRWNTAGLVSGLRNRHGQLSEWNHSGVRSVLRNPRYRGIRTHNGEEIGPAQWPTLVPEHIWRAVVTLLDSNAAQFKPKGGRRLLTGIARCAVCDEPIHVGGNKAGGPAVYRCPTGKHVTRRAEPVEQFVTEWVLERLRRPDIQQVIADAEDDGTTATLAAEADRLRQEMDTIALERMQRKITPRQFNLMNEDMMARLAKVEAAMGSTGRTSALRDFVAGGATRLRWDDIGIGQQRAVVSSLVSIKLHSGGQGVRRPPPETVEIKWRA